MTYVDDDVTYVRVSVSEAAKIAGIAYTHVRTLARARTHTHTHRARTHTGESLSGPLDGITDDVTYVYDDVMIHTQVRA